ncbi:MAG: PASTA domain-containing protein [Oscillospiraceae bacterium]|nr:PASTA domain-containing protein [Oscillospiraceae bacterium]
MSEILEEPIDLCYNCMREIPENVRECPFCGGDTGYENTEQYLPTGTVLSERYIVGKMLRFNGESAEYIGFDRKTFSRVTIREYMPDTLCSRKPDRIFMHVEHERVAPYKTFMSEFVELNKSLAKMRTLGHISPPIDMFGENNTGYVIFRYVEGTSLTRTFKAQKEPVSWEKAKELFAPLFTTLSLIHNAGIVHRGISPDNLIIDTGGELCLIGFCIADARTAGTRLFAELYPGYTAPEQYKQNASQGSETDVYGICALLYRMLTGVVPPSAPERVADHKLKPPHTIVSSIPRRVSAALMHGMEMDQSRRTRTITDLVTELFEEETAPNPVNVRPNTHRSSPEHHSGDKKPVDKSKLIIGICLGIAAVGFTVLIGFFMMILDNNSATQVSLAQTTTRSTEDTSAADTESQTIPSELTEPTTTGVTTIPTLAVMNEEDGVTHSVSATFGNSSTLYIMNDLVGKNYELIRNTSLTENLNLIPDYVYTSEYEKGTIFAQSIAKGENYVKGDDCIVSISCGPSTAIVPEFTGLSKRDYFDILNSSGIKYEEYIYYTDYVLSGYVAKVSIDPGSQIDLEHGEVLEVYIAKNSVPETTTEEIVTTVVTIPEEELATEPAPSEEPVVITEVTTPFETEMTFEDTFPFPEFPQDFPQDFPPEIPYEENSQ